MTPTRFIGFLAGILLFAGLADATAEGLTIVSPPRIAPSFSLQDLHGKTHTLKDYRGRIVVVNFWATWCPPCVLEMPSLQRAWTQLRDDDIQVLAINMGQPLEDIAVFTRKYPVDFPILLDRAVTVSDAWDVRGLPVTFVLNAQGQIVLQAMGERKWDDPALLEEVRRLR